MIDFFLIPLHHHATIWYLFFVVAILFSFFKTEKDKPSNQYAYWHSLYALKYCLYTLDILLPLKQREISVSERYSLKKVCKYRELHGRNYERIYKYKALNFPYWKQGKKFSIPAPLQQLPAFALGKLWGESCVLYLSVQKIKKSPSLGFSFF